MVKHGLPSRVSSGSPPTAPTRRWQELLVVFVAALLGLSLVVLAAPRTISALLDPRAGHGFREARPYPPASAETLDALIAAHERAVAWHAGPQALTALGLALLDRSERMTAGSREWRTTMVDARRWLRAGLADAPANPAAWTGLATAESRLNSWTPEAVGALRLALLTAPGDPELLLTRLRLALTAWPYLNEDDRDLIKPQIRPAWDRDGDGLAALVNDPVLIALVHDGLAGDPKAIADFDNRLRRRSAAGF